MTLSSPARACEDVEQERALLERASQAQAAELDELIGAAVTSEHPRVRLAAIEIARFLHDAETLAGVRTHLLNDVFDAVAMGALRDGTDAPSAAMQAALASLLGIHSFRGLDGAIPTTMADVVMARALRHQLGRLFARDAASPLAAHVVLPPEPGARMVDVSSGTLDLWTHDARGGSGWFEIDDRIGRRVDVTSFAIDVFLVTNDQYDAFAAWTVEYGHAYCHHDEPPGKVHERSTVSDERCGGDHPVTGVDWYDAYGFASWSGKSLPTADQWERAARGDAQLRLPWGNVYESGRCRDAASTFATSVGSFREWEELLCAADIQGLAGLTVPVGSYEPGASPFGVLDMAGNVWEWTRTRHLDRAEFRPRLGTLTYEESCRCGSATWRSKADHGAPRATCWQRVTPGVVTCSPGAWKSDSVASRTAARRISRA